MLHDRGVSRRRPVQSDRRSLLLSPGLGPYQLTEIGAKCVGIIQNLLSTGRVPGIDPYVVGILQRIDRHPAPEVEQQLTPRILKTEFGANPMRSDRDRVKQPLLPAVAP